MARLPQDGQLEQSLRQQQQTVQLRSGTTITRGLGNTTINKSNVWVVATVPGVYSWLGWGNVPQQYQVGYNNGPRFDPSLYGDWYPLGVYSLMTGPDDVGTRVLQLAVDRRGRINGNYFDMITDSDHSVSGGSSSKRSVPNGR